MPAAVDAVCASTSRQAESTACARLTWGVAVETGVDVGDAIGTGVVVGVVAGEVAIGLGVEAGEASACPRDVETVDPQAQTPMPAARRRPCDSLRPA
ncbi:MAG TPA: hypothetical protein VFO60_06860 [Candidatus Dormibacteraeota bacterium]|nr:hypothetical protein [Candidatus Dormibacteraeota bacterium]